MTNGLEKQLQAALGAEIPAEARDRVLAKVMAAKDTPAGQRIGRPASRRRLRLLRPVAIAAVLMTLFAGTALAASGAQPDSWIYPLKQKTEEARAVLAYQDIDRAQVEVGRAGKRLDEIESMVAGGKPEYVPGLLLRYGDHMSRAKELIDAAAARGEDTSEADSMMATTRARHDDLLRAMLDGLPDDVADAVCRELGDGVTPGEASSSAAGCTQGGSPGDGSGGTMGGSTPGAMGGGTPDDMGSGTPGDMGSGGAGAMPAPGWDGGTPQDGSMGSGQEGAYSPTEGGNMYEPAPSSGWDSGSNSGEGGNMYEPVPSPGWDSGSNSLEGGSTYEPAPSSGMDPGSNRSGW